MQDYPTDTEHKSLKKDKRAYAIVDRQELCDFSSIKSKIARIVCSVW